MLPTADKPLRFVLRLKIPALKNNRVIAIDEQTDKVKSFSNAEVKKAIAAIRNAIVRQIDSASGFPLIPEPYEVRVWMLLGVHYRSALPKADLDNAYTTIQEAMQELIYEDDRQVCGVHPDRRKFTRREAIYTAVYVWVPNDPNAPSWEELKRVQEQEAAVMSAWKQDRLGMIAQPRSGEGDWDLW